ncbi:hypothetical protein SAMN06265222_10870 [Neorhodopirellula lusitana]|uniref:Uncharacterized protein n=1 Tax=Neorhodopirellula lusitana TaxID=445327 RepID=A0ABY1QC69_9BACT|nr:hypothetical protein [Neorhodopirellula lusitana]SMP63415.1 hypothetical protein SAMN06265222_10870 [Neorhodopirellula lusitana]
MKMKGTKTLSITMLSMATQPSMIPASGMHVLAACLLLAFLSGCSSFHTEYGESSGVDGKQSVSGFGAFRSLLEESPDTTKPEDTIKTRDLGRLSSRADKLDAIVWIPQAWPPLNDRSATQWMERWLSDQPRTLVFVVPDGGSTEAYFREAAELAEPAQRLEYRRRLATQINDRLLEAGNRKDVRVKNWFIARPLPYRLFLPNRRVADYQLSDDFELILADPNPESEWEDFDLVEMDDEELYAEIDAMIEDEYEQEAEGEEEYIPVDSTGFESLLQESVTLNSKTTQLTTLAKIQDEQWGRSQVLVVTSGGLLTNFAMTGPAANELATEIQDQIRLVSREGDLSADESEEPLQVGFLSSDDTAIPISNAKPGAPTSTGMELLTTWPLSLVTMHGLFLGVVICLMLLPAFGRPRAVRHNRTTHFGNHLSAMATLMRRSGGSGGGILFAKRKISQYLRIVRGETSGPWVLPEQVDEPTKPASPESNPTETKTTASESSK